MPLLWTATELLVTPVKKPSTMGMGLNMRRRERVPKSRLLWLASLIHAMRSRTKAVVTATVAVLFVALFFAPVAYSGTTWYSFFSLRSSPIMKSPSCWVLGVGYSYWDGQLTGCNGPYLV